MAYSESYFQDTAYYNNFQQPRAAAVPFSSPQTTSRPEVNNIYSSMLHGHTDTETGVDSRRSSLDSNATNIEGKDVDEGDNSNWFNEEFLAHVAVNFDISSSNTLKIAKRRLAEMKDRIEGYRENPIVVKVREELVFALAEYVNNNWEGGCESLPEHLFFKASQCGVKSRVHSALDKTLSNQAPPGSDVLLDTILNIGGHLKAPDVAYYRLAPNDRQLYHPIAGNCPLPNLWVEVFFNNTKDRNCALHKIRDNVIPGCGETCAVLSIALANNSTPAMRARIFYDDPPTNPTNAAPILQTGKPGIAPYIGYWPMGAQFNEAQWFRMWKNFHLDITLVDNFVFRLEFNDIITKLL